MSNNNERAWTCINRWRRRGYAGQVEIFEEVMAENERLRAALSQAANDLEDWGAYVKANNARAALEGK